MREKGSICVNWSYNGCSTNPKRKSVTIISCRYWEFAGIVHVFQGANMVTAPIAGALPAC